MMDIIITGFLAAGIISCAFKIGQLEDRIKKLEKGDEPKK